MAVSLHAVISLVSLDVAFLAAADIATACSVARHSVWPTFRRLTPLSVAAARFCLATSCPFKVRLKFLIVVIISLISVFMAPAATIPLIEPFLYRRGLSTPSSRGYTRTHAKDDIRVVHALGITSSMYCSTRCVCLAPAYWIDPPVLFTVSGSFCP